MKILVKNWNFCEEMISGFLATHLQSAVCVDAFRIPTLFV